MTQLLMPKLGLTMTEGLLVEWSLQPGEPFNAGDVLFVVETDKVANEIEADDDGVLGRILVQAGETVAVGTPLAELGSDDAATARSPIADAPREVAEEMAHVGHASVHRHQDATGRVIATPHARRLARETDVDLTTVSGSGPRGRIKAVDVQAAAAGEHRMPMRPQSEPVVTEPDAARIATARRVSAANRDIPHFHVTHEAEITALDVLRRSLNEGRTAARISVTHMLIRALGVALTDMPELNRIWMDEKILAFASADVGMVADTEQGLRVPMIRDAGRRSIDEITTEAGALTQRARRDELLPADVGGGAISISNVGMLGVTAIAPIINPPQSMILGVGAERACFRPDASGQPTLRRELCLTLACDHRIHDGAAAARFLGHLVSIVENPSQLLHDSRPANDTPR